MKAVSDDFFIRFFTSKSTTFQICRYRSSWVEPVLFLARINVSCSRTQRSDTSEDQNIKQFEWDIKSLSVPQLQIINEHHFCLSWHSLFWNSSLLIWKGYSQDTTKRQLTVCMLVNCSCLCCCLLTFFKINFSIGTRSGQTLSKLFAKVISR